MQLISKSLSTSYATSTLAGQAVITQQSGEIIQIGEIYKNGQMFELSLLLMPVDGCIDLTFECDVQPGQRDLTAVVFGRHDTYEHRIGTVELTRLTGKAIVAAVPWPGQLRCQMLF